MSDRNVVTFPSRPTLSLVERQQTDLRSGTPLGLRQLEFGAALLQPDFPVPTGLVGPDGLPSARRFGVYRNNVVVGLVEALKATFPAIRRIVGDEFFTAMARIFVMRAPPSSPIMADYGRGFADFIGSFEPASSLPYLSDVARNERAWAEAYYAEDADPLDAIVFAPIPPDQLAAMRLALHPSVRFVRSSFPAFTIWQMNIDGGTPRNVDLSAGGENVLIVRPEEEVEVRVTPPGCADFIDALAHGCSIIEAANEAMRSDNRFDLASNLSLLIGAHAIVGIQLCSEPTLPMRGGQP